MKVTILKLIMSTITVLCVTHIEYIILYTGAYVVRAYQKKSIVVFP